MSDGDEGVHLLRAQALEPDPGLAEGKAAVSAWREPGDGAVGREAGEQGFGEHPVG